MGRMYAIMLNTFREAVRSKILYAILFFSLLLISSSILFGELSLGQQDRVMKNFGVVSMTLFSALIAVYTGVSLLYKEIEKKTIYTIVSKPIERWQFLFGKYGGILLTTGVALALMMVIFVLLLLARSVPLDVVLVQAFLLIFTEVALIAAIALLFSAFSTPFLSGMLTFSVFILGNLFSAFETFANDASAVIQATLKLAMLLLPDLTLFNPSSAVTHSAAMAWSTVGWTCLYGLLYTGLVLGAATLILRRRDFI